MMRRKAVWILLSLAALAWGQSQSITLSGTITDPSGAIVQRVKVQLVNENTGEDWTTTSNDTGNYFIPLIKPGRYRLSAELAGFKQHQQTGIVLETGTPARIDFGLQIGAVTESITVDETVPLLKTGTSAVGMVVDRHTIANMPLVDRRAAQLARLTGFVVMTTPRNIVESGPAFEMAGGRGGDTAWVIDGGNTQFATLGMPGLLIDPPVESIQEFNVSVSNYAAELGRTGGGVVQLTTRSGTNQFHGSAYEYFRHDKLDARNFFALEEPRLRYNQFGVSLGGPIRKNKAHFFFNYEGQRRNDPRTRILNLPAAAETRGDFSRSATIIRDPGAAGRPPFQGNVIPASRLDPLGSRLAAFYPEPNVPGRASGNSNYVRNHGALRNSDNYVGRLDYNHRGKDRVFGRLLVLDYRQHLLPVFPSGMDPFESRSYYLRYSASATWMRQFGPTTINELRFTFNNSRGRTGQPGGFNMGLAEQIGIRGTNPRFPPQINLGPRFQGMGISGGFINNPLRTSQLTNNVTHIRGNHELKFGFEWRPNTVEDTTFNQAGGVFAFGEQATGNSLAALLLGWVVQGQRNETLPARFRSLTLSGFVQDDWRAHKRLTLNLGLRWDWDQPRWESIGNRQNSFDRLQINPVSGTPGIVTFAGRNGLNRFAHRHDWNNFGPRVGFAWKVTDNWVVRGGAAVVYSPQYAAAFGGVPGGPANLGFSLQGAFASPDMGITPAFLLRNGLPEVQAPSEAALAPGFGAVPAGRPTNTQVAFFEPDRQNGYLSTLNFNVQRSLSRNLLMEIGYLGTLGHKLVSIIPFTINQLRPELMGPGNRQNLRPFPQFTNVVVANPAIGNSNYHGMNLKIEKRYSRGLLFQANYTWSRFIDDVVALSELGAGSAFTNAYNRQGDRGLAGNHVSHRFIWGSVWDLPIGSGRALHVDHPVWKQLLGGWSTGVIAELRSGPPYGVTELVNGTGASSPSLRPNVIGDPSITGNRSKGEQVERWFNTAAFAQPAAFTFGNAGRTAGYGPGAVIMDLSIIKDFRLAERHSLAFRTEMLNFINHANFALQPQNLARGNAAFGRITGMLPGNQSRIIQLGLHYRF